MAEDFVVMHPDPITRVELAMADLRDGRMIIMVDDEDRENEGDLVVAADKVTPEAINFMATHARGLICLSMTQSQVDRLGLPMMAQNNQSAYETAFTVSIEAREGVTTGISAADRAKTIQVAIAADANPRTVVTPGHIFPLRARQGGVLERVGQTEGSVDLARLAGLDASAVICEVMNADGTMARLPELLAYGAEHRLHICSVADIIKYRMRNERVVELVNQGHLDLGELGTWQVHLYRGVTTDNLHVALSTGDLGAEPALVRVQGAPAPWAFLRDTASALAGSARAALRAIAEEGAGALVLMHQGGTSTDMLQRLFAGDFGAKAEPVPTTSAEALRDLGAGCQILRDLGLQRIRILTNGTRPILGIEAYGLELVERVGLSR